MDKKLIGLLMISVVSLGISGCNKGKGSSTTQGGGTSEKEKLVISGLLGGHGNYFAALEQEFEKVENVDVVLEPEPSADVETKIRTAIQAKKTPDVIFLATGRADGLVETLINSKQITDITDVMDGKAYGEEKKIRDKIMPGFLDTTATNPYGDGKTYLAPLFHSPTGLFYSKKMFKPNGKYDLPTTLEEFYALGEKAKGDGVALFTYPTAGYFDTFMFSLIGATGGIDLFNKVTNYTDGIWTGTETNALFNFFKTIKDKEYLLSTTVANANNDSFKKNQQAVIDHKALFIPNGSWLPAEMSENTPADFEWGFMGVPKLDKNHEAFSFNYFEQVFVAKQGKNQAMAKKFISWLYSDKGIDTILNNTKDKSPMPVVGVVDKAIKSNTIAGITAEIYKIYENNTKPLMGSFAATEPVEGIVWGDILYKNIDSVMNGSKTIDVWRNEIESASDQLRAKKK